VNQKEIDWIKFGIDPYYEPCVGCGYCCCKVPCRVAFLRGWDRHPEPCKGLVWDQKEGRFWCQAVLEEPAPTVERLKEGMAIGAGCSSSLFNQQREACQRGLLEEYLKAREEDT